MCNKRIVSLRNKCIGKYLLSEADLWPCQQYDLNFFVKTVNGIKMLDTISWNRLWLYILLDSLVSFSWFKIIGGFLMSTSSSPQRLKWLYHAWHGLLEPSVALHFVGKLGIIQLIWNCWRLFDVHQFVSTTSQTSLKWRIQRCFRGTYPRRTSITSLQPLL